VLFSSFPPLDSFGEEKRSDTRPLDPPLKVERETPTLERTKDGV
jgi:hypothetical protein